MKDTDIAWLAGIIEGEGCIRAPKPHSKTVGIDIASTDKDIIERVAALMSASFCEVKQKNPKWKTQYRITLTGDRAITVMKLIFPYMGIRRSAKINEVLNYWETKPFSRRGKKWIDPQTNEPLYIRSYEGNELLKELDLG